MGKISNKEERIISLGKAVLETESKAIAQLTHSIDENFVKACQIILHASGRVIVSGMGKSGHIANKIASTLASTGTPSLFMHPGEASHGDLGMITENDVLLALSNSGETHELIAIIPLIKRQAIPMIALTGNPSSTLASLSTVHISVCIEKEACPLGLAPTASTTAQLAMGDAIAVSLLESRGFTAEDFARSHPGGQLGKALLLRVSDLFHEGSALPCVPDSVSIKEALLEMTEKRLGVTTIVDRAGKLLGIFTDGDLRRALESNFDIHTCKMKDLMTGHCHTVFKESLATEALKLMQDNAITTLVVVNKENTPKGVLHIHDCLKAGLV
jgi:arabinose-5-phosphate isomerase